MKPDHNKWLITLTVIIIYNYNFLLWGVFVFRLIVGERRAVVEGVGGVVHLEVLLLRLAETAVLDAVVHLDAILSQFILFQPKLNFGFEELEQIYEMEGAPKNNFGGRKKESL